MAESRNQNPSGRDRLVSYRIYSRSTKHIALDPGPESGISTLEHLLDHLVQIAGEIESDQGSVPLHITVAVFDRP